MGRWACEAGVTCSFYFVLEKNETCDKLIRACQEICEKSVEAHPPEQNSSPPPNKFQSVTLIRLRH